MSEVNPTVTRVSIVAALLLAGCTRPNHATNVLRAQGFREIHITGYRVFGCDGSKGSDDGFHTGFEAIGPNGQKVSGVVCEGLLKGATVRYD